jgi:hypothetical protein
VEDRLIRKLRNRGKNSCNGSYYPPPLRRLKIGIALPPTYPQQVTLDELTFLLNAARTLSATRSKMTNTSQGAG